MLIRSQSLLDYFWQIPVYFIWDNLQGQFSVILDFLDYNKCVEEHEFCLNGGTCEQTWTTARCHCTERYQGDRCDRCRERFQGDGCQECSPRFQGDECQQCSERFQGDDCQECTERFQGEECGQCNNDYYGNDCGNIFVYLKDYQLSLGRVAKWLKALWYDILGCWFEPTNMCNCGIQKAQLTMRAIKTFAHVTLYVSFCN